MLGFMVLIQSGSGHVYNLYPAGGDTFKWRDLMAGCAAIRPVCVGCQQNFLQALPYR